MGSSALQDESPASAGLPPAATATQANQHPGSEGASLRIYLVYAYRLAGDFDNGKGGGVNTRYLSVVKSMQRSR